VKSSTVAIHVLSIALLTGCAATRVTAPAIDIAKGVAAFQADLSVFQQSTRELQADQAALAAGNDVSTQISARMLEQLETEQSIEKADFEQAMKILETQANSHVAALLLPAKSAAVPTTVNLPLDKLSEVTTIVQKIAKPPGRKESLKSIGEFAKQTNDDLAALAKDKK